MAWRKSLHPAERGPCPGLYWTIRPAGGIRTATLLEPASANEAVFSQIIHVVEWPDLRHPIVDVAVRRTGRRRRRGQSLLPHQGSQDRSIARLRAALGDLQRLCGSNPRAAVMARLAASHRRRGADRRELHGARMGKAASAEPDGDAFGLPALRFDAGERPPARGHRRLPAVDAGELNLTIVIPGWSEGPDLRCAIVHR